MLKYTATISRYDEESGITQYLYFSPTQTLPNISSNDENYFFSINNWSVEANIFLHSIEVAQHSGLDSYLENENFNTTIFHFEPSFSNFELSNNFITKYEFKKKFSFTNFFISNLVDVPICFKKSKSLSRKINSSPILKFPNYFLRDGKKEKVFKVLLNVLKKFNKNFFKNKYDSPSFFNSWFSFYLLCNENFFSEILSIVSSYSIDTPLEQEKPAASDLRKYDDIAGIEKTDKPQKDEVFDVRLKNFSIATSSEKEIDASAFAKNTLNRIFFKVMPIFSFFIYNVDKNIRKFSRGKSGKYTFLWKFIAPHKRHYLVMRWLVKDCKFSPHKKFLERILQSFIDIILNTDDSFVGRSKTFSHNYVFKNFKKTLLKDFKTCA